MGKTSKKKHKKHRRRHSSSSSSSSNGSMKVRSFKKKKRSFSLLNECFVFQGDDQWKEVEESHHDDEIPVGTTIKGPTMPTKEDLEKFKTEFDSVSSKEETPVTFALEPLDFDALGSYRRENKQAIKKAQQTADLEVKSNEKEKGFQCFFFSMFSGDHGRT